MKKILTGIAVVGIVALAMTGCAAPAAEVAERRSHHRRLRPDRFGERMAQRQHRVDEGGVLGGERLRAHLQRGRQQDPEAQIAAVRSFINQGVDAIVIAPIVADGWDDVLKEAQDAGIPVILEDRTVSSADDLYASWVGLDFKKEGVTAGEWAAETFGDSATNMVVLEGTTGSAPRQRPRRGLRRGDRRHGDRDARLADG